MIPKYVLAIVLSTSPTYKKDVKPIIQNRCSICHGGTTSLPNFLDYKTAFKYRDKIRKRVYVEKSMPPGNATDITDKEREVIKNWVDNGAKE